MEPARPPVPTAAELSAAMALARPGTPDPRPSAPLLVLLLLLLHGAPVPALPAGELGVPGLGSLGLGCPQSGPLRPWGCPCGCRADGGVHRRALLWGAGACAVQGGFLGDLGQLWPLWSGNGWAVVPCKAGGGGVGLGCSACEARV